jgi:hypothetical protein
MTQSRYNMKETRRPPMHPGLVVLTEWREHICIAIQLKPGRSDSDDRVNRAIVMKGHADNVRITSVPVVPQAGAEDRNRGRSNLIVRSLEGASSQQRNAEHGK